METLNSKNALLLLLATDKFKARLTGEFSSIHGISVNEFLLMFHLETTPRHRLPRVELAKRMHVNASTITRMVAPMEKIGLVERQTDDRDARLAFVVMTEAGREKYSDTLATFAKQAGYLFDERWGEKTQEEFTILLHRLVSSATSDHLKA